jgi:hypothetical protein
MIDQFWKTYVFLRLEGKVWTHEIERELLRNIYSLGVLWKKAQMN